MPGNTLFDTKEVEDFIDVDDGTFWNDVTKIESDV